MALLSLRAAARFCGVPRSTLYRAVQRGALPRDGQGRIDTEDLLRLGYLSRAQAEAEIPSRAPPSQHARMLAYFDRLEDLIAQLERLLIHLRR
jgi:hypothetical protein